MISKNLIKDESVVKKNNKNKDDSFKKMCDEFDTEKKDMSGASFSHIKVVRGKNGEIMLWQIHYN